MVKWSHHQTPMCHHMDFGYASIRNHKVLLCVSAVSVWPGIIRFHPLTHFEGSFACSMSQIWPIRFCHWPQLTFCYLCLHCNPGQWWLPGAILYQRATCDLALGTHIVLNSVVLFLEWLPTIESWLFCYINP